MPKINSEETRLVNYDGSLFQIHLNGFALDHKGKKVGWKTKTGYTKFASDKLIHREVYKLFTNWSKRKTPKGISSDYWKTLSNQQKMDFHDLYESVDHIDGNKGNNKFENLQPLPYPLNSAKGKKAG